MPLLKEGPPWTFWGLIPGEPVQSEIMAFKRKASLEFSSFRALRSPAHLTLVPPVRIAPDAVDRLDLLIREINKSHDPFMIICNGFSTFPKRVVFVDINQNQSLQSYENDIRRALISHAPCVARNEHGFRPHITVAFRDLSPSAFEEAKHYFVQRPYQREWTADGLWRLDHGPEGWYPAVFHPFRGVTQATFHPGV